MDLSAAARKLTSAPDVAIGASTGQTESTGGGIGSNQLQPQQSQQPQTEYSVVSLFPTVGDVGATTGSVIQTTASPPIAIGSTTGVHMTSQQQTKRMKKRRELDALMKSSSRNGSLNGSPFNKDSASLLLIANSQSSTDEDEDDDEVTSNPQRARRNGSTVVGTKPHHHGFTGSGHHNGSCTASFACSIFIFTACFLLCIYLFWNLLAMQHRYDDLSSRFLKLESDVHTNVDALTKVTLSMQPLKDQIGNLTDQSKSLSTSLIEVKGQVTQLQSKVDDIGQVSLIQDSFDQFRTSLASNINSIETKLTDIETSHAKEREKSEEAGLTTEWKLQQESEIEDMKTKFLLLKNNVSLQVTSSKADVMRQLRLELLNNVTGIKQTFADLEKNLTAVRQELELLNKTVEMQQTKLENFSEAVKTDKEDDAKNVDEEDTNKASNEKVDVRGVQDSDLTGEKAQVIKNGGNPETAGENQVERKTADENDGHNKKQNPVLRQKSSDNKTDNNESINNRQINVNENSPDKSEGSKVIGDEGANIINGFGGGVGYSLNISAAAVATPHSPSTNTTTTTTTTTSSASDLAQQPPAVVVAAEQHKQQQQQEEQQQLVLSREP